MSAHLNVRALNMLIQCCCYFFSSFSLFRKSLLFSSLFLRASRWNAETEWRIEKWFHWTQIDQKNGICRRTIQEHKKIYSHFWYSFYFFVSCGKIRKNKKNSNAEINCWYQMHKQHKPITDEIASHTNVAQTK